MSAITWDDKNDRKLLLQLLALHPIAVTTAEWELISQKWNRGTKRDAFRKHFDKIKAEQVAEIAAHKDQTVKGPKSKEMMASETKGTKRNLFEERSDGKTVKKAKRRGKEEVIVPRSESAEIIVKNEDMVNMEGL